ncbi:MAG: S41 family peptidase [Candidatus Omnitrophica bacterium]|nr:S41 family peptidase [Candidatus Omnitrophota bacterium]
MKKLGRLSIGIFLFVLSISFVSGLRYGVAKDKPAEDFYQQIELFTDAMTVIRTDYVEEPKTKDLVYGALKGMLASLDPHSQFMDPDVYNEIKVETEGSFGGLGIEITVKDDLLTIISPLDDTPAQKAGIKAMDKIVKINGELTRDITLVDAVKKLRGKPGTQVMLTILREGEGKLLEVEVTRDIIKIESVKDGVMLEDHIGYLRISEFQENTPRDLEQALKKMDSRKLEGLILDLRNNPGGLLDTSADVAEKFLPNGVMVVYTKGRIKSQDLEFRSKSNSPRLDFPMVVLINDGSASASEIVAGALQDHGRAVLMGTKSFGKGSVQTVIPLKDGSALRLTTSKYYTPKGRSIHGEGIMPDIIVEEEPASEKEKETEKQKEQKSEEIFKKIENPDSKESNDQGVSKEKMEELKKDVQIGRAVDLLKGIRAYKRLGK